MLDTIDQILTIDDEEITIDEIGYEHFEDILKKISSNPVNCSEIGFQNSQQGACCCYDDQTPQTFGTCA